MRAPTDGFTGSLWRTLTTPTRAAAPLVLQARRALRGEYWLESKDARKSTGPHVFMGGSDDAQTPADGEGPLFGRRYTAFIENSDLDATQLLDAFRTDPNRFSPTSFAVFVPDPAPDGFVEGAEVEVKLPGPWNGPVRVALTEPGLIRLETREGHMEAGRIEFSTHERAGVVQFTIESIARSGDPVFHWMYSKLGIGKQFQTEMWAQVLESAVDISNGDQQGRLLVQTTTYNGADT